ncbi:MAG: glycine cleavage system protein GcvH [Chloroflexi bacterium]|nr:glycine cleavage system protein GcvH [Chloroflexota bacterium]
MSFTNPPELRYSRSHEWVRIDGDIATIGITDYAQHALGEVVYVELPDVGSHFAIDAIFGAVESVKAASDLYTPIDGEVLAVNHTLFDAPEQINNAPYEAGWMLQVRISTPNTDLLDAEAYAQHCEGLAH